VGLPGDWWIRTLPCTQEAVVLCGMNDCGQRGIEGTAQAQREEAHSSCGQGRHAAGARVGGGGEIIFLLLSHNTLHNTNSQNKTVIKRIHFITFR
jgi:hypothetical protein